MLHGLELAQPLRPSGRLAAVQPLQGDQLLLLENGAARFADHQLEDRAQARIVESVDQPVEMPADPSPSCSESPRRRDRHAVVCYASMKLPSLCWECWRAAAGIALREREQEHRGATTVQLHDVKQRALSILAHLIRKSAATRGSTTRPCHILGHRTYVRPAAQAERSQAQGRENEQQDARGRYQVSHHKSGRGPCLDGSMRAMA